ncbi:hypothetical protein WMO40_07845 [Bacillaceae bacterium CLA-AA-H227]|uniref:Uncharacterized protein n=1 Tax=Robertmurraya yapensis (ex Hitch et al 2024) TaxID=3133160 RepID=A0ACC6S9B8_9BACI|nr:hypothetical protein [Bacillus yapensis]
MPRGKEIEQLPMSNIAPSIGKDASSTNREVLGSIVDGDQPKPSNVKKEGK